MKQQMHLEALLLEGLTSKSISLDDDFWKICGPRLRKLSKDRPPAIIPNALRFESYDKFVIASEAKQSRVPSAAILDCRASLAMTKAGYWQINI